MMNRNFKIIILFFTGLSVACFPDLSLAQSKGRPSPPVIGDFKKMLDYQPPDPLTKTLTDAKKSILPSSDTAGPVETSDSEDLSSEVTFKNPFIPQLPQVNKPVLPVLTTRSDPAPDTATVPVPQFTVTGMVWNTKIPKAILNGKVVSVGDQIENWQVTEISKDGVRVSFADQNLWIKPVIKSEQSTVMSTRQEQQNSRSPVYQNPYNRR